MTPYPSITFSDPGFGVELKVRQKVKGNITDQPGAARQHALRIRHQVFRLVVFTNEFDQFFLGSKRQR
jgi:hypothetical protein